MTVPYPENPADWQTAYTRDQAHRDSQKYRYNFLAPVILGYLFTLAYVYFYAIRLSLTILESYPVMLRQLLAILILLLPLLLFPITLIGAFRMASSFLNEFYRPPEDINPTKIISNRLLGKPKLPPPLNMLMPFKYIIIKDGEILNKDQWPAWSARNLGGPLTLIVFDGCALYLERGNRFSRVVGPGDKVPFLEWYETIKYVVDLRPKVKDGIFGVWTKDGIKVTFTVKIECRIGDPAKYDPSSSLMYPYDPLAVKKAIERYALRWPKRLDGDPEEFTWIDAAWGQVTGIVPSYVGGRMLDDLFIADRFGGQILSPQAITEIFEKLNNATKGFGVFITDFQILKIELPKDVEEHQRENWMAERKGISTKIDGQAKAFGIRAREKARADAQYDLILAIAEGLKRNENGHFTEPMLLSLSNVLDESLKKPLTRAYIAKETLETLEQLKKMIDETTQPLEGNDEPGGIDSTS